MNFADLRAFVEANHDLPPHTTVEIALRTWKDSPYQDFSDDYLYTRRVEFWPKCSISDAAIVIIAGESFDI